MCVYTCLGFKLQRPSFDTTDPGFVCCSPNQTSYVTQLKSSPCYQAPCIRYTVSQHTPPIAESPWNGIYASIVGVQRGQLWDFLSDNQPQLCPADFPKLWLHLWKSSLKGGPVKVTASTWLLSFCDLDPLFFASALDAGHRCHHWTTRRYVIVQPTDKGMGYGEMHAERAWLFTHTHTQWWTDWTSMERITILLCEYNLTGLFDVTQLYSNYNLRGNLDIHVR